MPQPTEKTQLRDNLAVINANLEFTGVCNPFLMIINPESEWNTVKFKINQAIPVYSDSL